MSDELLASLQALVSATAPIVEPKLVEDQHFTGDCSIKPSGKVCKGYKFIIPALKHHYAIPNEELISTSGECCWRICLWDASVSQWQADSEYCQNCERVIKDKDLGTVDLELLHRAKAVQMWSPELKQWLLVEVPDHPTMPSQAYFKSKEVG